MSTYAIGDIQGCFDPLQRLLDKIQFDPSRDNLWLAGDLINRGPDSLATLRYLRSLGPTVKAVLGNHDLHFLAVAYGYKRPGSQDTLEPLLQASDRAELIDWLRQCPLLHHDPALGYTMVHAGIPPIWNLSEALGYAQEIEAVLQGDGLDDFLAHMYGNTPCLWQAELAGNDRLRLITNYFTRMRFCSAAGQLDLDNKTAASDNQQFLPWFAHPQHACANERILFGHWAALKGQANASNVVALDTGCVWGGHLTALRLDDGELFCTRCKTH